MWKRKKHLQDLNTNRIQKVCRMTMNWMEDISCYGMMNLMVLVLLILICGVLKRDSSVMKKISGISLAMRR